ncbi:MAG: hypothetical protein KatS3mg042_1172 [Rhodothermaceae bacterium]|nr:MAG: hypothetical protein KatS3mg042_1172 [Rhodothermaceae bacterium]
MLRYLDDPSLLTRYLELKAEIKRLQAELETLQPAILAALWEEPEQRAEYGGYQLTVGTRRTYAYSERVQALEQELKTLKKREEQDGTATLVRHTSFVVVRPLKPDTLAPDDEPSGDEPA